MQGQGDVNGNTVFIFLLLYMTPSLLPYRSSPIIRLSRDAGGFLSLRYHLAGKHLKLSLTSH
jgi:hypothetical protein